MPVWVVCHGLWLGGSGGFPGGACGCNLYGGGGGAGLRLIWLPCRPGTERRKRGMFLAAIGNTKLVKTKKTVLHITSYTFCMQGTFLPCARKGWLAAVPILCTSVADPGCLSRIPDPDFYPSRIPDLGSRIQKQQWKTGVKIFFSKPFFWAINFTKLNYFVFELSRKKFRPIFKEL